MNKFTDAEFREWLSVFLSLPSYTCDGRLLVDNSSCDNILLKTVNIEMITAPQREELKRLERSLNHKWVKIYRSFYRKKTVNDIINRKNDVFCDNVRVITYYSDKLCKLGLLLNGCSLDEDDDAY